MLYIPNDKSLFNTNRDIKDNTQKFSQMDFQTKYLFTALNLNPPRFTMWHRRKVFIEIIHNEINKTRTTQTEEKKKSQKKTVQSFCGMHL